MTDLVVDEVHQDILDNVCLYADYTISTDGHRLNVKNTAKTDPLIDLVRRDNLQFKEIAEEAALAASYFGNMVNFLSNVHSGMVSAKPTSALDLVASSNRVMRIIARRKERQDQIK